MKVTSGMTQQLASKLPDGVLKDYIIEKGKMDPKHIQQRGMEGLQNSVKNTVQEQASQHQQGVLQTVAHGVKEWEVLWWEEIMLYV
jgi:hypothetical protein